MLVFIDRQIFCYRKVKYYYFRKGPRIITPLSVFGIILIFYEKIKLHDNFNLIYLINYNHTSIYFRKAVKLGGRPLKWSQGQFRGLGT